MELTAGQNPAGDNFLFASGDRLDAEHVRGELGVSVVLQQTWRGTEEAFNEWRARLEAAGVIVFKRSFKQMSISGFCLPHETVPVIVVNNGTTWARQIFTLFHELCHLGHHHYGVTRADQGYLAELQGDERKVEVECNRFASEVLLPQRAFAADAAAFGGDEADVERIAGAIGARSG